MRRKKRFGGITVAGVPQKEEKNWGAQIILTLALGGVLLGATFAFAAGPGATDGVIALCVCIASGIVLVATAVRALRSWDY